MFFALVEVLCRVQQREEAGITAGVRVAKVATHESLQPAHSPPPINEAYIPSPLSPMRVPIFLCVSSRVSCLARLSTRQRLGLIRRCGEPPKVGNSSLASYRKLSYWLPSALALTGSGGESGGATGGGAESGGAAGAGRDARARRAAMFRSRSLRQRLSEGCEAVMESEAVKGSTSTRRERGLRTLFAASGSGAAGGGGGGGGQGFLSSTRNSVILIVGIFAAMVAYQRYAKV